MTGAPMPARRRHRLSPGDRRAQRRARPRSARIAKGANVRMRGEDVEAGAIVVERGTVLRPQELGLMPRRSALAGPGAPPAAGGPAVDRRRGGRARHAAAARPDLRRQPLRAARLHRAVRRRGHRPRHRARRARRAARAAAGGGRRSADVVVTSGGVSVGVYDLVKEVLGEIGAIDFWQVAMQPGRPLAFGRDRRAPLLRAARQPGGLDAGVHAVRAAGPLQAGRPARALFPTCGRRGARADAQEGRPARVQARHPALRRRRWEVRTTGPQGSGILSSMVAGNCLIVLEEDRGDVAAGETVLVEPF